MTQSEIESFDINDFVGCVENFDLGVKRWYQDGKLHRDDGPAVIVEGEAEYWYQKGIVHRENGPAIIYRDGAECWYRHGRCDRSDGPAIIWNNGRVAWFVKGVEVKSSTEFQRLTGCINQDMRVIKEKWGDFHSGSDSTETSTHQIDTFECIEYWTKDGELHRDNGPAAIYADGRQYWYQHGQLHRDDGPAIMFSTGSKSWFQHGKLHRVDGPAILQSDGRQLWYLNHRHIESSSEFQQLAGLTDEEMMLLKRRWA